MSHTEEYTYFMLQLSPPHNWPKASFICVARVWVFIKNNESHWEKQTVTSADAMGRIRNSAFYLLTTFVKFLK